MRLHLAKRICFSALLILILFLQLSAQDLAMGVEGESSADPIGIDPIEYLTTWNFNNLPEVERREYYKETLRPDGTKLREYWIHAVDREIEIAQESSSPRGPTTGRYRGLLSG